MKDETGQARAARAIEEFLSALGLELEGELVGTGERVATAWATEFLAGVGADPARVLMAGALEVKAGAGPVVLHGLEVATMCPHHLLPSHGTASVGFFPRSRLVGLGAIQQAVDLCARRLILQESLGELIADTLLSGLDATGTFCRLALTHTCFSTRGERQAHAVIETIAFRGTCENRDRDLATRLAFGARA
jgi:GTP cyclohydrolase I